MDINELLYREQISLANAANAACEPSRLAHKGLAQGYAARLIAAGFPHHHQKARRRAGHREAAARPAGNALPAKSRAVG
jgi:hypothetical protein